MPLSMPLSWIESLDHLEHVMGPYWCLWAGPHHFILLGDFLMVSCAQIESSSVFEGMFY